MALHPKNKENLSSCSRTTSLEIRGCPHHTKSGWLVKAHSPPVVTTATLGRRKRESRLEKSRV
jgi:hypothetical protein